MSDVIITIAIITVVIIRSNFSLRPVLSTSRGALPGTPLPCTA